MSLIVMKFGGTSVATAENRASAIAHIKRELREGRQPVVVVSAMGRMGAPYATDTLLSLLHGEDARTRDLISSCGEVIAACVFTDELQAAGVPAEAFTGESAGIQTTKAHGCAQIIGMNPANVLAVMEAGKVPVITGFQGRTLEGRTTTIGRGGSDTSAVVIGGYLGAETVDIYTDVDGVAKADPRMIPEAAFMTEIASEDMLTLAQWGASVIHPNAVRAGVRFQVPMLRVRSTFTEHTGTAVIPHYAGGGFMGLAVLGNLCRQEGGAYALGEARYEKRADGTLTIITAVYPQAQEAIRAAAREQIPGLEWFEDRAQVALPMELAEETARRLYQILQK